MTLVKVVGRFLGSISALGSEVLQECFVLLLELVIRLKEVQEEDEAEDDGTEYADNEYADDDTDDDESSEDDEHEETEEEFLERYAKAAVALEDEIITKGDVEDQVQELELGILDEVDLQKALHSLIGRYHQVLLRGVTLSPELITRFVNAFPEYSNLKAFG